jgi:DNA-binding GntR family transcriptional regulator
MSDFIKTLNFQPTLIGQQISKFLMDAIINNELNGGEQLVELELQKRFGISRSPLREAYRDLEKLNLVEIVPRKGTYVKKIYKQDIIENYAIRAPLEGIAAREAYSRMTQIELNTIHHALEGMMRATLHGKIREYWKKHSVFHDTFINASGNNLLINIIHMLRIHSVRHRLAFPNYDENLNKSLNIHKKIFKMFKSQNTDKFEIEMIVRQHIDNALEEFLKNVKVRNDE